MDKALQPAGIKEAIEAVHGSPIARTKPRMVFAVAGVMFGLSPVDTGAPLVPNIASEVKAGRSLWAQSAGESVTNSRSSFRSRN